MGRLIDADVLREEVYSWGMNDYEPSDFTDAIDDAPTVEAIPKANYENRLKADMVAMLTEIQIEFDEKYWRDTQGYIIRNNSFNSGIEICIDIIQEKINALKAESERI